MTPPRRMHQVDADGEPFNVHLFSVTCESYNCVPVTAPPVPPDARLRAAAQAVVARWRFGPLSRHSDIWFLEALQTLEAVLAEKTP